MNMMIALDKVRMMLRIQIDKILIMLMIMFLMKKLRKSKN